MVLWVVRKDNENIVYNDILANPLHSITKELVKRFENGVGQCYPQTALGSSYITAEVGRSHSKESNKRDGRHASTSARYDEFMLL